MSYVLVDLEDLADDVAFYVSQVSTPFVEEPIIDKLKTEIKGITPTYHNPDWSITDLVPISEVLKLVDKYRAESENA